MDLLAPVGTPEHPVRVAIIGAGPAGFFLAEALLRSAAPVFDVDLIERLPTPFGLVRSGVAPDHQAIKTVYKTFEKTASHGRFRFLGNVAVGRDVTVPELKAHYHQVVYAIGSAADRRLGLPGEELAGSYAATAFVGWYNAHPDFVEFPFDLHHERVVVVGIGNVALDVARLLLRSPDELATTDIAEHALEALRGSHVREVVLLARRGPRQAAFDVKELRDIAALPGVHVALDPTQIEPEAEHLGELDAATRRSVETMLALSRGGRVPGGRTMRLEFYASPKELLGDAHGHVRAVQVERTALVREPDGEVRAVGTGQTFELETGAVFRSVGYRGVPLEGLPFDAKAGIIPNVEGRIVEGGQPLPGLYAVGWCRRGATGVIGTNKADANKVAEKLIEDVPALARERGPQRTHPAIDALLSSRDVRVTSFDDWSKLDAVEVSTGLARGKLREKFVSVDSMMNHLLRKTGDEE
jgi:ferredoxin--NADP+ reductase